MNQNFYALLDSDEEVEAAPAVAKAKTTPNAPAVDNSKSTQQTSAKGGNKQQKETREPREKNQSGNNNKPQKREERTPRSNTAVVESSDNIAESSVPSKNDNRDKRVRRDFKGGNGDRTDLTRRNPRQRDFDRKSANGREDGRSKRQGGGAGNWGKPTDQQTEENKENVNTANETAVEVTETVEVTNQEEEPKEESKDVTVTFEEYSNRIKQQRESNSLFAITEVRQIEKEEMVAVVRGESVLMALNQKGDKSNKKKNQRAVSKVLVEDVGFTPAVDDRKYNPKNGNRRNEKGGNSGGYRGKPNRSAVNVNDEEAFPSLV